MFLLLLVAVLLPTVCLLWFMSRTVRNERLAVRDQFETLYQSRLVDAQGEIARFWEQRGAAFDEYGDRMNCAAVFAGYVRKGLADSVVCYDSAGRPSYPSPAVTAPVFAETEPASWRRARNVEYAQKDPSVAAGLYRDIAQENEDANSAARGLQAQVRCLLKADQKDAAVKVLTEDLLQPKHADAVDPRGRLIVPSAQLLALQLLADQTHPVFEPVADALRARLTDYGDEALPSAQRRFLMGQLKLLVPDAAEFVTYEAELLAARYLETDPSTIATSSVQPSGLPDVWRFRSRRGTIVGLFRQAHLLADLEEAIAARFSQDDARIALLVPGAKPSEGTPFATLPAGDALPNWQLGLHPTDPSRFDSAADEQVAAYVWSGGLVILLIFGLAGLLAHYIGRQMRLTRLKNDLVATVTHELKTPLSSMRVLVDTLLDGQYEDKHITREYLELIAKENIRLSRLIDNFLSFSRMERNKRSFDFREVAPSDVVAAAIDATREKFESAGFRVETQVPSDLPALYADADAIVGVLLNLLDNAYKYSDNDRHVIVRAYEDAGAVCFDVEDHGIGLSRRAARRVFDRFYRVDQRLSRKTEGCGLGLDIVQFVVTSHGGEVAVESQPGEGSKFTVRLPAAGSEEAAKLQRATG
ncbi:MAG: HAMP domain-containing histidine kinase [Phycisphaerales bacterium]|nr:MAG: HAMP domain-containing histidine kinase [Phycisphaerales bacterium]